MYLALFLNIFCFASGVFSLSLFSPCKISDVTCLEKSFNDAIPQIYAGSKELEIEATAPLKMKKIIGDLKVLKYIFTDSTFNGGQNVVLTNLEANKDFTDVKFSLIFTNISLSGKYEMNGKLFDFPIEGSGDYSFKADKYNITIDTQLERVKGDDGKTHLFVKSYKLKCLPIAPIAYDFENLLPNKKELAETIHKFANENWLQVALLVQDPGWNATMDIMFDIINQYLKHIPIEDIISN